MNFERPPENLNKPEQKEKTPLRLRIALKGWETAAVKSVEVDGRENLKEIPPGKKIIIATTHITDLDLPIVAYELSRDFNIVITHKSTHRSLKDDPASYIGTHIAGIDNFIPLDYKQGETIGKFNPDNFVPADKALEEGKAIVIAAHDPAKNGKMPENGGYGAAYMSGIESDAIILPVAVDIESENNDVGNASHLIKTVAARPKAKMTIGEPLFLDKIEEMSEMENIMDKRKNGEALNSGENDKFHKLADRLRKRSSLIMETLAAMVPPEKRGSWNVEKINSEDNL
ncbi:hypothetical protein M1513_00790 [Patescibacteria group bacterium]|nr:hypothetical protein [Patescibacteria group bacterium]MCL5733113.1 hypothetical protein [Patescibacteria group bacterium]